MWAEASGACQTSTVWVWPRVHRPPVWSKKTILILEASPRTSIARNTHGRRLCKKGREILMA
jgi:hypothetical protein